MIAVLAGKARVQRYGKTGEALVRAHSFTLDMVVRVNPAQPNLTSLNN